MSEARDKERAGRPVATVVFLAAASVLVLSIALTYWIGLAALKSNRKLARQREVIQHLELLASTLKDAETGQRGYLLTGEGRYLEPYQQALGAVQGELEQLSRLAAQGELAGREVSEVRRLSDEKLAELEQTIKLRREGNAEAAQEIVRSSRGRELMDALRGDLTAMEAGEVGEFQAASRRAEQATHQRSTAFLLAGLLNLAVLAWAYRRITRDVAERRRWEEALKESEQRYRSFVEASAQVIWRTNARGEVDQPIPSWYRFTGQNEQQASGFGWMNVIHPDDRPRVTEAWRKASAARGLYQVEYRLKRHDGQWLHILARGVPVLETDGQVREYIGTCIDVTEQRQAEAALREGEERFRTVANAIPQLAWVAKPDGWIYWYNRRWYEYTGTTPEQMEGWGWQRVHDPRALPSVLERWKGSIATGEPLDMTFPLRGADGVFRPFLTRVMPLKDEHGRVLQWFGTNTDVTEQQQAQEAVQKQARLIDLAPAATMVRAMDGTISFWSDGAEKLYGWTRQEAIGRRSHELLHTEFPEPPEQILAELRRGGKWSGELRHCAKDGRRVIAESHWLGQLRPDGELAELLESNIDITERKRNEEELRRLKEELEVRVQERTAQLSEANKELEAFGYSVSHDLRAPLRHIDSYINVLQKNIGASLDEKSQKHLQIIVEAGRRMGNLIDDLLVLSRLGRATMEERPVNLRRLLDEARQELAPGMAGRSIEWHVGPLPQVRGDPNLLRSAMANLLSNAIKYTRERNPARIEVGSRKQAGELVCFVRDNGAGFDMRFVDKLFGVFQRLHRAKDFEGTGIGLASVRRVIQRHGGRTWAEGEVGKGATFYFSVPGSRVVD